MSLGDVSSVSEVIGKVKSTLEGEFRQVVVEGEVSNLSSSSSGHWYFTLSDAKASLKAALFKIDAYRNPLIRQLKDGDKVVCVGGLSVYAKRGTFQIVVKRLTPAGKGDLKAEFEKLKKKLAAEGLFDPEHKKEIPSSPKRIAVITAEGGAALQDFLNILWRRTLWTDVLLIPSLVQGDAAPRSLRAALHRTIKYALDAPEEKRPDVIVLTRGGGSLEDLWAFNDEGLAWDIYNCPIPVISAVGHQVDYSLTDFVADKRLETPSAAAEILSSYHVNLWERLVDDRRRLIRILEWYQQRLHATVERVHPRALLGKIWNRLHFYEKKLAQLNPMQRGREYTQLNEFQMRADDALQSMRRGVRELYENRLRRSEQAYQLLKVLDPHNILSRGYTYVRDENGHVVASEADFNEIEVGKTLTLQFKDGSGTVEKSRNVNNTDEVP